MAERKSDRLFTTTWIHVFEEDTAGGAVYRPEDDDIPLSRRPRERLRLHADGSGEILVPGPDDRAIPRPAAWREEGGEIVVRAREGGELRIVSRTAERLVVKGAAR